MDTKKSLAVISLLFASLSSLAEDSITVDISEQRLYLLRNMTVLSSYPISSSSYGEGQQENSFKTPLGQHVIKEMIGDDTKEDTIFISRINTKRTADIVKDPINTGDDYVTSRILWLSGEEEGVNKGGKVDSYNRYIYIHGTQEEGLIGLKASHGCIRMFNNDVIDLYQKVKIGTKVLIKA